MSELKQFRLPDAGEGLTAADVVSWKVKVGDVVKVNDVLVEIETAKSLVELPSPFAGVVNALLVAEGVTVAVGTPIIAIDVAGAASSPRPRPEPAPEPPPEPELEPEHVPPERGKTRMSVLVGYGVKEHSATRRRPRRVEAAAAWAPGPAPVEQMPAVAGMKVLAKPPVRKLAKDAGIELATLTPTGPGGIVTRADVEAAVRAVPAQKAPSGGDTRIPVKGVRRATAQAMVASAFSAPHVTEWVQVDLTRTVKLVDRLRADPVFGGVKVSPLLIVATALLVAVRRNPGVNASWDEAAGEIVVFHDVNLGIAAATPRGLLVPNVKGADRLGLRDLAAALGALTATAREGRTPPQDLVGGTITITNVGVFGVDGGTPILNPGESMILAVGRVRQSPWVHKGKVKPRWVTTLAVSFDHRLVDGDLGSRFLADVAAVLEDPVRALAWG